MTARNVTARIGKGETASEPVTVTYDFGDNLQDAVKRFGEDVVWSHFVGSAVITVQARIRSAMSSAIEAGKKPDVAAIQKSLNDYKIGTKAEPANKVEKVSKLVSGMTAEQKAELRKLLAA